MNLEECYEAIDSDYDDVMRRLGSETLVRKFVLKFLDDTSFRGLKEGLENQDAELAFRSAHTLKGVCMNLGFTKLFEVSSALTEELRDKEIKRKTLQRCLKKQNENIPEQQKQLKDYVKKTGAFINQLLTRGVLNDDLKPFWGAMEIGMGTAPR